MSASFQYLVPLPHKHKVPTLFLEKVQAATKTYSSGGPSAMGEFNAAADSSDSPWSPSGSLALPASCNLGVSLRTLLSLLTARLQTGVGPSACRESLLVDTFASITTMY